MKRNSIISMEKLPNELLHTFKETYPYGYSDYVQKVVKPSGETMYVVRFETDDVVYAIKVNPFRAMKKNQEDALEDTDDSYDDDDSMDTTPVVEESYDDLEDLE